MFKFFALFLIGFGIYIGVNYTTEVHNVIKSDAFKKVQEKLVDGKDVIVEKLEGIKNSSLR